MIPNVIRGKQITPRRVLLYGTHGVGKSSWAAQAPSPIFIPTEDGLADIDCDKFPLCKFFGDIVNAISILSTEDHSYRTVVLDTLDWAERLIHRDTAQKEGKGNLEDFGYGKGYTKALDDWDFMLRGFTYLREARGMSVILLAHAKVERYQAPEADPYDRYSPDTHKSVSGMLQEWCDEVLFATYRVSTIAKDLGFDRTRTRAIGTGERVVYTTEMSTHLAKRRVPMPDVLPLDFNVYAAYLVAARGTAPTVQPQEIKPPEPSNGNGDIEGVVTNGHSKIKEPVNE